MDKEIRETSYKILCEILQRMEGDILNVGEMLPALDLNKDHEHYITRSEIVLMLTNLHNDMDVALTRLARLARVINYDDSMPTPDWIHYNLEGS